MKRFLLIVTSIFALTACEKARMHEVSHVRHIEHLSDGSYAMQQNDDTWVYYVVQNQLLQSNNATSLSGGAWVRGAPPIQGQMQNAKEEEIQEEVEEPASEVTSPEAANDNQPLNSSENSNSSTSTNSDSSSSGAPDSGSSGGGDSGGGGGGDPG